MKRWKQIRGRIRRPDPEIRRKALRHWNNLTRNPWAAWDGWRRRRSAWRGSRGSGSGFKQKSGACHVRRSRRGGGGGERLSAGGDRADDRQFRPGRGGNQCAGPPVGAELVVVDVGSKAKKLPPSVIDRRVRPGTADMTAGPAMTREEALQALDVGIDRVEELVRGGVRMIAIGEMGIGNTTAGTAIAAVFTGRPVEVLTGRGTGIDDRAVLRKREAIRRGDRGEPARSRRSHRRPGQGGRPGDRRHGRRRAGRGGGGDSRGPRRDESTAAALAAARLLPEASEYLFASHLSAEPAHRFMLEELGLRPLIDAEMRLGEGTGAVLCFPLIDGALSLAREMADLCRSGSGGAGGGEGAARIRQLEDEMQGDAYGGIGALRPRRGPSDGRRAVRREAGGVSRFQFQHSPAGPSAAGARGAVPGACGRKAAGAGLPIPIPCPAG